MASTRRQSPRTGRWSAVTRWSLTIVFTGILAAAVVSGPRWFVLSTSDRVRIWCAQWNIQSISIENPPLLAALGQPPRFGFVHFRPTLPRPTWSVGYSRSTTSLGTLVECSFPLWLPLVLVGLPAAWMWRAALTSRARARRGRCLACGYDLSATPHSSPCPECGRVREPIPDPGFPSPTSD